MKKTMLYVAMVALAGYCAPAAELSQGTWRSKIGDAAQSAAAMKSTIAQVAKPEQCAFVKAVNGAIGKMSASKSVKAQRYVDVNRAAIQGAAPENRKAVLAEVFAVVPVEALTSVEKDFSQTLFNRSAQQERTFTDAEFSKIASDAVGAVADRCESVDGSDARTGLAILLFTRASGGTPADLPETLADEFISEKNREAAKKSWLPSALADGAAQTYGPMLGESQQGEPAAEPDHAVVLPVASQDLRNAFLSDLSSAVAGAASGGAYASPAANRATDAGAAQAAAAGESASVPKDKVYSETLPNGEPNPYYKEKRGDEPGGKPEPPTPYDGQEL